MATCPVCDGTGKLKEGDGYLDIQKRNADIINIAKVLEGEREKVIIEKISLFLMLKNAKISKWQIRRIVNSIR